ncbi:hypothetical protein PK98_14195 [Croceibacterium mercuriale]|uniref:GlsB/YeaQ/YmgE family stress response membrane protein n=1 Tax=Croceibacterium mercuriale TaxID=1572751 RepID=A0A0B2BU68_9SPHN|nr:hypothetical protein [Croceibacterium mercuriale]KHL24989.1 hypothetical protein PK98_14195 [Croceibacterium mercuriale]
MLWWVIILAGASALGISAARGANAVWGTATLGVVGGLVLSVFYPGQFWLTLLRSIAIGALVGAAFEALARLSPRS